MGTKNRERRRQKQQRRTKAQAGSRRPEGRDERAARPGGRGGDGQTRIPPFDAAEMRSLLRAAAMACRGHDQPSHGELIARIDRRSCTPGARQATSAVLLDSLVEEMRRAWSRGWQPLDVVRLADRQLTPLHRRYLIDVIAVDAVRYTGSAVDPRWSGQLDDLGAVVRWRAGVSHLDHFTAREGCDADAVLEVGIEVLALLVYLPELPLLCPPPGEPGHARRAARRHDTQGGRMLVRVRALLAKAESTTFAAEAEALTAKAQELMARHAIDEAMVDGEVVAGDGPVGVRLAIDDPYASAKSLLLSVVASANSCRAVWFKEVGFSTVFGFETDLEFVEVLYTSLLVQATAAITAAGTQVDRYGRSRTRSFRQSFLVAYASRIGDRLRAAQAAGQASATEEYGDALLPVLASRASAVSDAVHAACPGVQRHSPGMSNYAGWAAGSAAADLASLSVRREVSTKGT